MNSKEKRGNLISVLAVYFAANVIFIMSPAMNSIATNLYPDIPYGTVLLLSTISSLLMIPGSLSAGAVLGKQVRFRTMAIVSLGGIVIAGVLPYFITNFTAVLIFRAVTGFCIGLGFPLQSTLALKLFDDNERPGVLGKATVAMSVGAILYMLISGAVCDINTSLVWLVHGIILIPFILVILFLKEPEQMEEEPDNVAKQSKSSGEKLPGMAVFTSFMFMVVFFAFKYVRHCQRRRAGKCSCDRYYFFYIYYWKCHCGSNLCESLQGRRKMDDSCGTGFMGSRNSYFQLWL